MSIDSYDKQCPKIIAHETTRFGTIPGAFRQQTVWLGSARIRSTLLRTPCSRFVSLSPEDVPSSDAP
jgi:hypothetical protein